MSTIVLDCPRCNAHSVTFDVYSDKHVGMLHGWVQTFELFAICRRCSGPSVPKVELTSSEYTDAFARNGSVAQRDDDVSRYFRFKRFTGAGDVAAGPTPDALPDDIAAAFDEGARALAVDCPNAAGAMFRLCLDLATKSLLPADETDGLDKQARRNLAPRIRWLFSHRLLPSELRELSAAVKEHGDEGAHAGTLGKDDAEDLYDFAFRLLDRLYSEPARIREAAERRAARHAAS